MESVIGMHNHRVGAKNSLADFLNECLESGVSTVSITDHKTLKTYIDEFPKLTMEERKKFQDIIIFQTVFNYLYLLPNQKYQHPMHWLFYTKLLP